LSLLTKLKPRRRLYGDMRALIVGTLCAATANAWTFGAHPTSPVAAHTASRMRIGMEVKEEDALTRVTNALTNDDGTPLTFAEYLEKRDTLPAVDVLAAVELATRDASPPAYMGMQGKVVRTQQAAPDLTTRAVRILGPLALASGAIAGTLAFTKVTTPAPISMDEVVAAQKAWGNALVGISQTYLNGGDYIAAATKAADELYGYGRSDVLFKPTKAAASPFRPTPAGALSYFVGGDKVEGGYAEDKGFALGPGGVGWKKVIFDNDHIDFNGGTAQAMGEYYFYSAADDSVAKVEYTFGYKRNEDGKVRIYLHHSSLPYVPH